MAVPHNETFTQMHIARIFKDVVDDLGPLYQFAIGSVWEPNQKHNLKYPLLFLELPGLINQFDSYRTYNVAFLILDRPFESTPGQRTDIIEDTNLPGNAIKTLTKCEELVYSVLGYLKTNHQRYLQPNQQYSLATIIEDMSDRVYGYRVELIIQAPISLGVCDLPILTPSDAIFCP